MNALKFIPVMAAIAMTSCNSGDDDATDGGRVEVKFSANTAEIRTRVTDNSWTANDPVGIYMIGAAGALAPGNIVEGVDNRQYEAAAGTGAVAFTPVGEAIYYPMSGNVEFIAYYPYRSPLTDFKLPVDVANQGDQSAIDVLYAPKTNGAYNKSAAVPVDLRFRHSLVKLKFSIATDASVIEPLSGLTVNITGQQTAATLDLTGGTVTPSGGSAAITAKTVTSGAAYEAIVLPNENVNSMTFTFTTSGTGGGTYEVAVPAPAATGNRWEPGYQYAYTVTLKRNEAEITGTVSDWGIGGSYNATAAPEAQTVLIPKGTFLMGSPDSDPEKEPNETPQHSVTLTKDYYMSKYQITNAQYAAFLNVVGVVGTGAKAEIQGGQRLIQASNGSNDFGLHYNGGRWDPVAGYDDHPVIYVTWYGAKAYAEWAGGDLPTEAQWERAARGGENKIFGIGDGAQLTSAMANFNSNEGHTTAVGSYPAYANAYGLYDMHGNVCEWCLDWDGAYTSGSVTDPTGPAGPAGNSNRLIRGGGWSSGARYCRSACRSAHESNAYSYVGFRVVFYP
jgi:formylglycine-generating enzyme required for sulfatase activity